MHRVHIQSGGRYPVLRALAILYLIVAAVAALATVAGIVYALALWPQAMMDRLIAAAAVLAGGAIAVITLLAIAEVLKLFIDVEHNTRLAAMGAMAAGGAVTGAPSSATGPDGGRMADEETAEAALLRGH